MPHDGAMQRTFGRRTFDFSRAAAVMAIINRTPDSFYDRGADFALDAALATADRALAEVADSLAKRAAFARSRGVQAERIIVDPGHDSHKNTYHSLELTRRLGEMTELGYPVLVALSNKDFIGETLDVPLELRVEGSLAAAVVSVLNGASIVRVHEVGPTVRALRMTEAIIGRRPPATARRGLA